MGDDMTVAYKNFFIVIITNKRSKQGKARNASLGSRHSSKATEQQREMAEERMGNQKF